jgi:hypothetical protein
MRLREWTESKLAEWGDFNGQRENAATYHRVAVGREKEGRSDAAAAAVNGVNGQQHRPEHRC